MKCNLRSNAFLVLFGLFLPALLAAQSAALRLPAGPAESLPPSLAAPAASAPARLALTLPSGLTFAAPPGGTPAPPAGVRFGAVPDGGPADASTPYLPTYEWFAGYSYDRSVPMSRPQNRLAWASGFSTSLAINLNQRLGIVVDGAYYRDTKFGPNAAPAGGVVGASGNLFTLMTGPRFSFRHPRFTPFVQGLFGMAYDGKVQLSNCSGFGCTPLRQESSYTLALGGGLDITLTHQLALRLFQLEYAPTRFRDPTSPTGALAWQNDMRLSTGLVFRFGGGEAQALPATLPAPTLACAADPESLAADSGAQVALRATANDSSGDPLTYTWTATGGAVEGHGADAQWNPAGLAPGEYTVNGRVANEHGGRAECSVAVRVSPRPHQPPTLSCTVAPAVITAGESARITAAARGTDQSDFTYRWQAAQGQIAGNGPEVSFDSTGLPAGTYTATGHVDDGQGGTADCSVALQVEAAAQAPEALEAALQLHSIYFPTAQPGVQAPDGGLVPSQEAILTTLAADFRAYLAIHPDAQLRLEGHADERASQDYNQALAERRVASSKRFLVGLGVPAGSLQTHSFGEHEALDETQVRQQMQDNPDLTPEQRQALLANLPSIILAQNRRVDIVLVGSGQSSERRYPFNAKDALTLLSDTALKP